jgi:hypothetical protein
MLMHRYDIDEAAAFAVLRRLSQMRNIKLHLIADKHRAHQAPTPETGAGGPQSCLLTPPVPSQAPPPGEGRPGYTWVARTSTPSPARLYGGGALSMIGARA